MKAKSDPDLFVILFQPSLERIISPGPAGVPISEVIIGKPYLIASIGIHYIDIKISIAF